ncbi:butyrate kinase [Proteinivorax tanatarense]|uniref:Probable butyrate kinase n=1 Tax=Proteinivorax tanatarense TaxID=1260629 RepID=A0AAU7VPT1_9FIRM
MNDLKVLAINPGSTSTKLAYFSGAKIIKKHSVDHNANVIKNYDKIVDQLDFRLEAIENWLDSEGITNLDCVVGRGGLLKPMPSGTYTVSEELKKDLKIGVQGEHASNLGGLIADRIAKKNSVPAFIVDPVAVDEFDDIARISGMPEIDRRSLLHALNIKAVAHRASKDLNKDVKDLNVIIAHLGGGISIVPLTNGRMIDVNNANEYGPFSPERSGGLPVGDLVKLAFSGKYDLATIKKKITREGGLVGYLGTNDARDVEKMIVDGDKKAELIYKAMAYQISKEIAAMATVLQGNAENIILTGGLSYSDMLVDMIKEHTEFIAPILVYPGEDEMTALCEGALRVLTGEEKAKTY